jgi:hypothetical protein
VVPGWGGADDDNDHDEDESPRVRRPQNKGVEISPEEEEKINKLIASDVDLFASLGVTYVDYAAQPEDTLETWVDKAFKVAARSLHPDKVDPALIEEEKKAIAEKFDIAKKAKEILRHRSPVARQYLKWYQSTHPGLTLFSSPSSKVSSAAALESDLAKQTHQESEESLGGMMSNHTLIL